MKEQGRSSCRRTKTTALELQCHSNMALSPSWAAEVQPEHPAHLTPTARQLKPKPPEQMKAATGCRCAALASRSPLPRCMHVLHKQTQVPKICISPDAVPRSTAGHEHREPCEFSKACIEHETRRTGSTTTAEALVVPAQGLCRYTLHAAHHSPCSATLPFKYRPRMAAKAESMERNGRMPI